VQITIPRPRLEAALRRATHTLLDARTSDGPWPGELSSSALATATAVTALALCQRHSLSLPFSNPIHAGLTWLSQHHNPDGGWGDTIRSHSNLSTTTLCWAAFGAAPGTQHEFHQTITQAEAWITLSAGSLHPDQLAPAILSRYAQDRTFSVPILTLCALAGRLGSGRAAWRHVIPLPFELAACPPEWFASLRLPVVSYALPALIAIGQARFHHAPPANPATRVLRHLTRQRTLNILETIQPPNGGFLEASPLTSFVTMSLASIGLAQHPVARKGADFLLKSQRPDGSWPIDTNLATWLTTLSVQALGEDFAANPAAVAQIRHWLLAQQHCSKHPYTNAAPGGWAWTDLPGGVPDADDTASAVLVLKNLGPSDPTVRQAARAGLDWLMDLQNRDGGIPTFCRGWGTLPFDRSSPDITGHALRAWTAWLPELPEPSCTRTRRAIQKALAFLAKTQRPDGSWTPLWFGNQFAPNEENPTYGTARVLTALTALLHFPGLDHPTLVSLNRTSALWLTQAQNPEGAWGGAPGVPSSVEETALAVEALAVAQASTPARTREASRALHRGITWLVDQVETGQWTKPAPIGFYFAKLSYFERLYPLIFTVGALRQAARLNPLESA
jgi:squalene-hopene/tetraprenyl-beta-curcumene cyclase